MKHGRIEKITNGGWGLVRSDEGVVFLNYVLPGEEVSYRIKEKAKGILWGETLDVLTPSRHRIQPPCPYFGQCGGCIFQHIESPYQKEIKKGILVDDLKRIGDIETNIDNQIDIQIDKHIKNYIESPPYRYRIRARMKGHDDGRIGFIRKGTNTVIPIEQCLLFPDPINKFLSEWNIMEKPPFFHQLDIMMNPADNRVYIHLSHPPKEEDESVLNRFRESQGIVFSWKTNKEIGVFQLDVEDYSYFVSPTVFFQVNQYQWANMLAVVESHLHPCECIIDLYSGVGFFIPLLKKYAQKVVGVESFGFSVNLARCAFPGIEFLDVPAEKFRFPIADILVVDPPRSGLSPHVRGNILEKKYKKVIYISCSSATFSRDLKILCQNGYHLESLTAFDLFPQTSHLETIALFTR